MAWSYSTLKAFETCPRQFKAIREDGLYKEPDSPAILYGNELHKAAEMYVVADEPLPKQFAFMQPVIDAILAKPGTVYAEREMALDERLNPVGWWDHNVWVRGKADLLIVDEPNGIAWCVDWKSGKDKYPDRDQLVLMSVMVMRHYPMVQQVNSALMFVVAESMVKAKFEREKEDITWWQYRERVALIDKARSTGVWNPKPSGLCKKHCPVLDCEYNGKAR